MSTYTITVSNQPFQNYCTLYFENGTRLTLEGEDFGLDFSKLSAVEVSNFVKNYLKENEQ